MALMEALLRIKADVQGEGKIGALGNALGGLQKTAGNVSSGLKGMVSSMGGVAGAMGTLTPLLSAAGLIGMAKASLDAGNQMWDLSQKTGVSVEMLAKLKKAAVGTGTDIEAIGGAMVKLSKNIAASVENTISAAAGATGSSTAQLQNSLAGQVALYEQNQQRLIAAVKTGAERQVAEVQDRERRQIDVVRAGMERAVDVVKQGEQKQLDAVDRAAEARINSMERETDARLREINRRYRQEEKLLNDSYDDRRSQIEQVADDEQRAVERQIERRYEARRKAIQDDKTLSDASREALIQALQDDQEKELTTLRRGYAEKAKERDRQFRDQQERDQQAIEDRKRQEEEAEKTRLDALKRNAQDRAKAEKDAISRASAERQSAIKKQAAEEERIIKAGAAAATKAIQAAAAARVKALTDQGAQAKDAFKKLGIELRNSDGSLKNSGQVLIDVANKFKAMPDGVQKTALALQLFGKSGASMIPILNKGGDAIDKLKVKMTEAFAKQADEYDKKLKALGGKIGAIGADIATMLLPALDATASATASLVGAFDTLPGPLKAIIGAVALLSILFVTLAPAIAAVVSIGTALAGLQLGATIAGWLGVVGPAIGGITALLGGLLAWVTGTLIPGLLAVFSGPLGWTVLAIAAVVAMVIAFREPIWNFLVWLTDVFVKAGQALLNVLYQWFVQPWVDLWNNVLKGPITALIEWLGGVISVAVQAMFAILYQLVVQPWVNLWNNVLRAPVLGLVSWVQGVWANISKGFSQYVTQPIVKAWNAMLQFLPNAMKTAVGFVQNVWTGMITAVKNALRSFLVSIANNINTVVGMVNKLIAGFNALPGGIDIPFVPRITVTPFATGGVVDRPTLGLIGEGGQREYIVPENQMAAASSRYLAGARGAAVLSSRSVPDRSSGRDVTINVRTGPVMEFNGDRYVKLEELDRAMRITAEGVIGRLRTPAARRALGVT